MGKTITHSLIKSRLHFQGYRLHIAKQVTPTVFYLKEFSSMRVKSGTKNLKLENY